LHFTSRVESGAWSGEPLFVADLDTCAPAGFDLEELRDRLDGIEERMTLEIDIESVKS
jgi:glycine cleavage system regulatory protein